MAVSDPTQTLVMPYWPSGARLYQNEGLDCLCSIGEQGGMHVYSYYANMDRSKSCGEEVSFQDGKGALIIQPDKDYTIRLVVGLNSAGVLSHFHCTIQLYGAPGNGQLPPKGSWSCVIWFLSFPHLEMADIFWFGLTKTAPSALSWSSTALVCALRPRARTIPQGLQICIKETWVSRFMSLNLSASE